MSFKSILKSRHSLMSTIFASMFLVLMTACGGGAASVNEKSSVVSNNIPPSITVASPVIGGSQSQATLTNLSATAIDEEDGDISSNIDWNSDIDGSLGTGSNILVQLSNGEHSIAATVTDSGNKTAEIVISYEVRAAFGVATVSWTQPTQNTDGSNLTDLAGFNIYYGNSEQNLTNVLNITNASMTAAVIESLTVDETYYFRVTAVNELGIESELSQTVSKLISN